MASKDVSLTDTKPFLEDELQKISDQLDRTKKLISTTEDVTYRRAIKNAVDMMKPPSFSASQGTSSSSTRAYEQKETGINKKNTKSHGITTRPNKTKGKERESSDGSDKKKLKPPDAAVSKDALEIPYTTNKTGVSPTKRSIAQHISGSPIGHRQMSKKRPHQVEPLCGEETFCDGVSLADDQKSKKSKISVGKLKGSSNTAKDLDSLTMSQNTRGQKGTKQRPVQRRLHLVGKRGVQESNTHLPASSSETDTEKESSHKVHKYLKNRMPDFEEEKGLSSSELSLEMSSPECTHVHVAFPTHDDPEEDIQLPVVVLQKEPAAIKPGAFVWCKFQQYPYWPSLVKLVDSKHKKATIIFLEESISDPTKKVKCFKVALRSIKHYDCPEKQQLLESARKDFGSSIDWCDSLISDYRIRLGCGSFSGSFKAYCTAAISLPVRRELESGKRAVPFPIEDLEVTEDQQEEIGVESQKRNRKLLPDRARAARDRANEKLVEFIVDNKEAENHLLAILAGKKKSEWLKKFQASNRRINCLETYIEDEEQMELVVCYLQTVCEKMSGATKKLMLGDQTQFIFEVLLPEAVIFAIAATGQMSYEKAKVKYLKGPCVTKRERKIFEEQILEKKRLKLSEANIKNDSRK
ncbi:PWWP domain-containing DNA repair factor 3A isoform X3 [Rhinoderma darwinii]|uniref:PWWP domain-containing DNA repair factor 3A isoform X3 n=1 Tax=Rhinoderma darwinii TaxID=43563 RepID=UPI003F6722D6